MPTRTKSSAAESLPSDTGPVLSPVSPFWCYRFVMTVLLAYMVVLRFATAGMRSTFVCTCIHVVMCNLWDLISISAYRRLVVAARGALSLVVLCSARSVAHSQLRTSRRKLLLLWCHMLRRAQAWAYPSANRCVRFLRCARACVPTLYLFEVVTRVVLVDLLFLNIIGVIALCILSIVHHIRHLNV